MVELEAILNHRIPFVSLPELLRGWFLYRSRNLVVTGTHGKTTISTMLAFLLEKGGLQPSWFIGGVPVDLPGGCHHGKGPFWVLEGDEYDTSFADKRSKFLHYLPELVILNNVEFDHADIYKDIDEIKTSFRRLLQIVPTGGIVLFNADDANCGEVASTCPAPTAGVGFGASATHRISNVVYDPAERSVTNNINVTKHIEINDIDIQKQYIFNGNTNIKAPQSTSNTNNINS